MSPTDAPALLHVVGYLTGVSLYAMLLAMVLRGRGPAYRLTVGTALLGLGWNLGELAAHGFDGLRLTAPRDWMSAASYVALGFLAAVVVHSAAWSLIGPEFTSGRPSPVIVGALLAARRIDAIRLNEERYERMLREREIGALATEAELRALRAQINPHFLFNALTTLGYLIQHAPVRAFDTLMRLTTLLRSVLRSDGEFTTLGHERELIACYLEIEHERFEERLDARIDIAESLTDVPIPSLIVQPLVENAIKHGIGHARAGGRVVVTARIDAEGDGVRLRIRVSNTGALLDPRRPASDSGIGLRNVERRLHGYYGDAASVTLTLGNGETVAEVILPAAAAVVDGAPVLAKPDRR